MREGGREGGREARIERKDERGRERGRERGKDESVKMREGVENILIQQFFKTKKTILK